MAGTSEGNQASEASNAAVMTPIPAGWEKRTDSATGLGSYYHLTSGIQVGTVAEVEALAVSLSSQATGKSVALSDAWVVNEGARRFYVHNATGARVQTSAQGAILDALYEKTPSLLTRPEDRQEAENEAAAAKAGAELKQTSLQQPAALATSQTTDNSFSKNFAAGLATHFEETTLKSPPKPATTSESLGKKIAGHIKRHKKIYTALAVFLVGLLIAAAVGLILFYASPFLPVIAGFIGLTAVPSLLAGLLPGLTLPILTALSVGLATLGTVLGIGAAFGVGSFFVSRAEAKKQVKEAATAVEIQRALAEAKQAKTDWKGEVNKVIHFTGTAATSSDYLRQSNEFLDLFKAGVKAGYDKEDLTTCLERAQEFDPRTTKNSNETGDAKSAERSTGERPPTNPIDGLYGTLTAYIAEIDKPGTVEGINKLIGQLQEGTKLAPTEVAEAGGNEPSNLPSGWKMISPVPSGPNKGKSRYHNPDTKKAPVMTIAEAWTTQIAHDQKKLPAGWRANRIPTGQFQDQMCYASAILGGSPAVLTIAEAWDKQKAYDETQLPAGWKAHRNQHEGEYKDQMFYRSAALDKSTWTIAGAKEAQVAYEAGQAKAKGPDVAPSELKIEIPVTKRESISADALGAPPKSGGESKDATVKAEGFLEAVPTVAIPGVPAGQQQDASNDATPTLRGSHSNS